MKVNTMAEMMASGTMPEYLFWVGCAGSFDQRAQKITKAFATILNKVGFKSTKCTTLTFGISSIYFGIK